MIRRHFACGGCNRVEVYPHDAVPACCGIPMLMGEPIFTAEPEVVRYHLIQLARTPEIDWSDPTPPMAVVEVWRLRRGRTDGERLGWIGQWSAGLEWRTPVGVAIERGRAATFPEAVRQLILALAGGVHARQRIAEVASASTS